MTEITDFSIEFICPECGHSVLCKEQIAHETMEISHIEKIEGVEYTVGGDVIETQIEDVLDYMCSMCGFSIGHTEEDAIAWLKEHNMVEELPNVQSKQINARTVGAAYQGSEAGVGSLPTGETHN